MVVEELIQESDKPTVMRALLLRHRHVNEHSHGGFYFGSRRKFSSYTSLQVRQLNTKYSMPMFILSFIQHNRLQLGSQYFGRESCESVGYKYALIDDYSFPFLEFRYDI